MILLDGTLEGEYIEREQHGLVVVGQIMTNARLLFAFSALLCLVPRNVAATPEESVVKVIATVRLPDPSRPWTRGAASEQVGTGVVIEGKRILTNSHVVLYATEVHIQARPGDAKVEAKVQAASPDVDLAVLSLKDESFLEKRPALIRASRLPQVQDPVVVYGFPIGGTDLAVTKGTISRLSESQYSNRGVGLTIQISAPVNPGNSGGPAVVTDKMVGLVSSRVANAQNIGSVIPNEEIEMFLEDLKDGHYDGKPTDVTGTKYQKLENEALRQMLRVPANVKGILVHPPPQPPARYPLQPLDVITKIGPHDLDDAGLIQLDGGPRVFFLYQIPRLVRDQAVPLTVWRKGKTLQVQLPVNSRNDRLIPAYDGGSLPYFIHGPLIFAPARAEDVPRYAQMHPTVFWDGSPLTSRWYDSVHFAGEELVVVSAPMFTHKLARGYTNPAGKAVKTVNDVRIKNLRHLVETLRDCTDEFLAIRFADRWEEIMVFNRVEIERATEEILEDHGIATTRRGSPEMLKLWQQRPIGAR